MSSKHSFFGRIRLIFFWNHNFWKNEGTFEGNLFLQGSQHFLGFDGTRKYKFCPWLSFLHAKVRSSLVCLPHLWSQVYHGNNCNKIEMIDFMQCWNGSWYHLYESYDSIYHFFVYDKLNWFFWELTNNRAPLCNLLTFLKHIKAWYNIKSFYNLWNDFIL